MAETRVENIGPRQRMKRGVLGVLLVAGAVGFGVYLVQHEPNRYIRATVFVPFWFGWLCLFQASAATCVFHARDGTCNLDQGVQPIHDPALQSRLRWRARGIYFKTTATALLWTFMVVVISYWDPQ